MPTVEEIREWLESRSDFLSTHSEGCWKWHADCVAGVLFDYIDKLDAQNDRLQDEIVDLEIELAVTRNERDCQ